jgi:hypothetical protein
MNPYQNKKLIAFDVDGTIAKSRGPIDGEMADLLQKLLKSKKVAIITGGAFSDIERQVLQEIGLLNQLNKNLILLPTNGGGLYTFDGEWKEISSHELTLKEKEKIINAIQEIIGYEESQPDKGGYGNKIQDRNSEITYSALGEHAPIELKQTWDPDFKKRIALQNAFKKKLPEFEVKIGGTTSVDVTPKGMDKAYGIKKLIDYLRLEKEDVLFFGDTVYENGNDYPVFLMDVDTIRVSGPEETKERLIRFLEGR